MSITREQVMECLDYNPETGVFTWKVRTNNRIHIGDVAGILRPDGYRRIQLDGRHYLAGRLAFLIMHGHWPTPQVDHINGVRGDNRIANLREVSRCQNQQNRSEHRAGHLCGTTLLRGNLIKPWKAQTRVGGEQKHIGYFATEQEAHAAYLKAVEALGETVLMRDE